MTEPAATANPAETSVDPVGLESTLDPAANPRSIWPAIYPELLRLVREHTSTIIFVNNRRGAERLAKRLNELHNDSPTGAPGTSRRAVPRLGAGGRVEIARAHHGSLAHEERLVVEELLKSGKLPCLVATSLARARDRHGRARPRDPGRVAEIGLPRHAARRPRRPPAGRGLQGPDLPQVPRRPARVRGRCRAHAPRERSRRR